ncbi:hypothetical protein ASPWEDRAFT_40406 [Aspergillus wentii DTO 134E9]|uniref:Uncharacterized protein n=1 Tax=Aspergillus wentii DTO 134E9 TaxID=1073089 RepID=A0A1L9RJW2_ASPWE|nr:uncharacterized protein ASPWEDRAFT_40406 [Aspergillus wentii DTO 134E9]OJJ35229.1 hypothetical protein ASPWEDRAFT_40406 [Aspergillus wentii DTO 134E9]
MSEEVGEAAEERRRIAREEIQRRSVFLDARRRKRTSQPGSFDSLVDDEGRLRDLDILEKSTDALATSTAVDLAASQHVQRGGISANHSDENQMLDTTDRDRLHIDMPSPGNRSTTLVDLTPTSEVPDHGNSQEIDQSGFFSVASQTDSLASSHTEEQSQGYAHAHPDPPSNETHQDLRSPFADLSDLGSEKFTSVHETRPTTPSSADGSFSHVYETAEDASSDGTLSDLGQTTGGVATPASWSEVGSVISDDDIHHL